MKGMKISAWMLGVTLGLLGFGTMGMARTLEAQPSEPTEVVSDFYAALAAGDHDKALSLVDPDGTYIENPDVYDHKHSLRIFVDEVATGEYEIEIVSNKLQGADTVVTDLSISGGDVAGLPHPAQITMTATVQNGKITYILAIFSDQTLAEIAALEAAATEQPGMPKTGGGGIPWLPVLLLTTLLSGALGLAIRQAGVRTQ